MSKPLSEVELNEISSLAYLDIIQAENSDIANLYKAEGAVTVGDVIDYYLAQGEFEDNQEGPTYMKERFSDKFGGKEEYKYWQDFLEKLDESQDTDYRGWKISNIKSENKINECGFVAYTIETAPGVVTAAFRGSEPLGQANYLNDWETDFRFAYSNQTKQEVLTKKYIQSLEGKIDIDQLYITGHSLGGHLGLYAAFSLPAELEAKLVSCSVFAAPGFNQQALECSKEIISRLKEAGKIREFQNKYDPVGSILYNPTQAIYVNSNNPNVDNFKNHSNFFLAKKLDDNGNLVFDYCEIQKKDIVCTALHLFTTGFENFPDAQKLIVVEGTLKLVEKALSRGETDETFQDIVLQQVIEAYMMDGEGELPFILDPSIDRLPDELAKECEKLVNALDGIIKMVGSLAYLLGGSVLERLGRSINKMFNKIKTGTQEGLVSTTMNLMMVDLEQLQTLAKKMGDLQEQLKTSVKNEIISKAQSAARGAKSTYSESEVSKISNNISSLCERLNKEYNEVSEALKTLQKDLNTTYKLYKQEEKDIAKMMF